ncbi:DUF3301 domain-containing protein [Agaribacter marinus]|uniref:DUF3301 domain-containing protein n=1 Tax=Agaribacter marinus TaxID=1431249 RepID=A0AA37SWA0_9ALTE|nr:DUF3301 domain-containing protein [Agaribacter marinus]GLR70843.1 hypothetical protein GCM10007852_17510 [Agaribacter marinus]
MTLLDILILAILIPVCIQFWRIRGIAEYAVAYSKQYCERENLQYISLARTSTKLGIHRGKLDWKNSYELAFSSDGETAYIGTVKTVGKKVIEVNLPVYRVV